MRHALTAPHPVIDLRLLAIPTFRAGVVGASLFRIGVGAIPFLMPLLLAGGLRAVGLRVRLAHLHVGGRARW